MSKTNKNSKTKIFDQNLAKIKQNKSLSRIKQNKSYSYNIGKLTKGCQLCIKGRKTVLLITGICPRHCYYCPLSDQKFQKDVIYANEWKIKDQKEIFKEIEFCDSKGVGITGGDPLCKLKRTIDIIKKLKTKFGKDFHIHLYTSLDLVNEKTLSQLYNVGLDEIRFHLRIDDNKIWDKLSLAKQFSWKVGVEIPVLPDKFKETKKLIDFIKDKIDFLNLNELEISDTNAQALVKKGFKTKNELSYGVKDSEKIALKLLNYCQGKIKNVHYCTCKLKDKVQLSNRLKLRAKNIAKEYDLVNREGMLIRGCIYIDLPPIKKISSEKIKKLNQLKNKLIKEYEIPSRFIDLDKKFQRLTTNIGIIENISVPNKFKKAIVVEYPTIDRMIVELEIID